MTVVVDTNMLFNACLTPAGRIFQILFNTQVDFYFISSNYAIEELFLHKAKLIRLSQHSEEDMDTLIGAVLKQVEFFNEEIIDPKHWVEADRLTKNVDSKDISFVALTLQTDGILWTGDRTLVNHLKKLGFDRVTDTAELYRQLEID